MRSSNSNVKVLFERDFTDGKIRIYRKILKVPKSERFPEELKYAFNYLVFIDGEWKNIVRIDNHTHDIDKAGCHIHRINMRNAEFVELKIEEIYKTLIKIGDEIKKRIKNDQDKNS